MRGGNRFMPAAMPLLLFLLAGVSRAAEADAGTPVAAEYHQPTDVFNALDNLPDWLPGYTASAYGDYWEKHFGLDGTDRAALAAYAAFRRRTSDLSKDAGDDEPPGPDGVFAPAATRDLEPFARYFLEASSFEAGAAAAIGAQSPQDQDVLRAYYARFAPRAISLVGKRARFGAQRAALESQLSQRAVPRLAEAVRTFYGAAPAPVFTARFVWWPDPDSSQAKVRGRYILLYSQADTDDGSEPMDWAPIALHEFSHYLSAGQPSAQKQRLTAAFLQRCPAATALPNPLNALEEPLAIYWGQYRFEHDVRGRELPPDDAWYIQPLADRTAKAIAAAFPADGPAPTLEDPALMVAAASTCAGSR